MGMIERTPSEVRIADRGGAFDEDGGLLADAALLWQIIRPYAEPLAATFWERYGRAVRADRWTEGQRERALAAASIMCAASTPIRWARHGSRMRARWSPMRAARACHPRSSRPGSTRSIGRSCGCWRTRRSRMPPACCR